MEKVGSQDGSRWLKMAPKMAPKGPKMLQDAPRWAQDAPKMAPRCPKRLPRWALYGPKVKDAPKTGPRGGPKT